MNEYYTREETDKKHQEMMTTVTTELQGMQSVLNAENEKTRQAMNDLSEKSTEMMKFLKGLNTGIGVAKISWKYLAQIGAVLGALGGILLIIKFGLVAVINWALMK